MQGADTASGDTVSAGPPWDRARILGLASDRASRRAVLAVPGTSWRETGHDGSGLVWGNCRGSGASPYQVVVDQAGPTYRCSCPSRKVPCKHAVALLLRWVDGQVPEASPPEHARGRSADQPTAGSPADRRARGLGELADPAAAVARAAARAERVAGGLAELRTWLGDQVRGGLAGLERAGYGYVDAVAARMIDAQAPGVAGLLRAVPGELAREGWPGRVLEQLAALHLLVEAHERLDVLPPDLAATVRSRVGYPVSKSDVLAGPGVEDEWVALGQVDVVEYRLETRRVWLWGTGSRRWALWLTFAPPGGTPDSTVTAGTRFRGRLHFYPGSGQYRAVVGEQQEAAPAAVAPPTETLHQARARFAALLADDPWATRMPAVLEVAPVAGADGDPWRLRDRDGWCRPLVGTAAEPWPLLAQARGREVLVVVEWSGAGLRPLAVLDGTAVRRAA